MGGKVVIDNGAMGTVVAPNLTSGSNGAGARFELADWIRAIRHGVGDDGQPFILMPSQDYAEIGSGDLLALVAFLQSLEPVERELPDTSAGPIARMLYVFGELPLPAELIGHKTPLVDTPNASVSAEYGAYLAGIGGCRGCHGANLAGGPMPGQPPHAPPPANLTLGGPLASWNEGDFFRAFREGKRPDGSAIDEFMPWQVQGRMADGELRAIWLYLRSVPAITSAAE